MSSTGTQPGLEVPSESQAAPRLTDWQRWRELGLLLAIAILPSILGATFILFHPVTGSSAGTNFRFAGGLLHQVTSILLVIYVLADAGSTSKVSAWIFPAGLISL